MTTERGRPSWEIVQAAERGWPPLLTQIRDARDSWERAAHGLTADEAPPGPREGEWGPWQVLNHLAGSLEAGAAVVRSLTAGESVDYPPPQKWFGDEVSFAELDAALRRHMDQYVDAVKVASAGPETAAAVTHVQAGTMSAREWTAFGISHLTAHADQLRELRLGVTPPPAG